MYTHKITHTHAHPHSHYPQGVVKEKRFKTKTGLQSLKTVKVSKAQAAQRMGRAGRETSGFCYRLYTEKVYNDMKERTRPEILRINLSEVILQLISLGIRDVVNFDFLESPLTASLKSAIMELSSLGALNMGAKSLPELSEVLLCVYFSCSILFSIYSMPFTILHYTIPIHQLHLSFLILHLQYLQYSAKYSQHGKILASLPLEPIFGNLLVQAQKYDCLLDIVSITAMLSCEPPFLEPYNNKEAAARAKKRFESFEGDHIMQLTVYNSSRRPRPPRTRWPGARPTSSNPQPCSK